MSDFKGKHVLVTGGAMGIGRLMALRSVEEGASRVTLWDINQAAMDKTAAELQAKGAETKTQVVDVSSLEAIQAAADETLASVGAVDILFNNAGVVTGGTFLEHSHADFEKTIRINVLGVMHVARCFVPKMVEQGAGHVINIASAAGLIAVPLQSAYAPSKWACLAFSEVLRIEMEMQKTGVHVTTVCPSYINTGMFDGVKAPLLTPIMEPDDAVNQIVRAVKRNQIVLRMPPLVRLLPLFKGVLPVRAFDFIVGKLFRSYASMSTFKGH